MLQVRVQTFAHLPATDEHHGHANAASRAANGLTGFEAAGNRMV
jgi:hypothetical protein